MTAFIKQEAMEKAREIHLKADEEFAIEKSKLVRQETQSMDSQYEKKFKQAAMSQQITRSTSANKTRLRVLQARQELLDKLFDDARKKIVTKGQDHDYDDTLKGLILEGMYILAESKVGLRCKKSEQDKVKQAADTAAKEYNEKTGDKCDTVIDEKEYLPEESYVSHSPYRDCSLTCMQRWRRLPHWQWRQDRAQQHSRRAAQDVRDRGSAQRSHHLVRSQREQKVHRLDPTSTNPLFDCNQRRRFESHSSMHIVDYP